MFKKTIIALAMLGAAASAQSAVLLTQNFNVNNSALAAAGYVFNNASPNVGSTSWGEGDVQIFAAQSGPADSYLSANYNNASTGAISNWFLTPVFSTSADVVVSFWARGANDPGFFDSMSFGFSNGSTVLSNFTMGATTDVTGEWTKYTATLSSQGAGSVGRFAIQYMGDYDTSDYIGIDTLSITQVPEPASLLVMGTGLFGLMAARRRKQQR